MYFGQKLHVLCKLFSWCSPYLSTVRTMTKVKGYCWNLTTFGMQSEWWKSPFLNDTIFFLDEKRPLIFIEGNGKIKHTYVCPFSYSYSQKWQLVEDFFHHFWRSSVLWHLTKFRINNPKAIYNPKSGGLNPFHYCFNF